MRSKLLVAAIAVVVSALAGCGSGGSGTRPATHRAAVPGSGSRPTSIYRAHLSGALGKPHGAMGGVGAAILAFHGDSLMCWRFAHLHGFTDATSAHIRAGGSAPAGRVIVALSPGPRLHHQGCVSVSPAVSRRIRARPAGYYVSIDSKGYSQGAVRGQL
jgi:hypothetical protein